MASCVKTRPKEVPLGIPKDVIISEHVQLQPIVPRKGDNPQIYQLYITDYERSQKFNHSTFRRCTVGSPSLKVNPVSDQERVLMLVGATGAGKTTLINGIANYIYGIKWEDDYRLTVVHKEGQQSQAFSQTKQITAYTFPQQEGSPLKYTLTVIDTPGFGDSEGPEYDLHIVDEVKKFFSLSLPEGIENIQGIGFVVKASDGRLTPMQFHIFNSVLGIFGKDVENNIFIIITFSDGGKPLVLDALKEADIPFHEKEFKFNNSALFTLKDDDGDDNDSIYRKGMKSFWRFFERFEKAVPQSIQQTKMVLEERKHLEELIQELRQQIVDGIGKLTELKREEAILAGHKEDIEANKEFTYTVPVTKHVKIETKERVTNCIICDHTCHQGCVYNRDKQYCKVIQDKHCTVCPGKCHYRSHVNQSFYLEKQQVEETRTSEQLRQRFNKATEGRIRSEEVVASLNQQIENIKEDIMIKIRKTYEIIQRLNEISLNTNHMSETDYISLCIAVEKQEVRPGWQERIKYFENLLIGSKFKTTVSRLPQENLRDIREGSPNQPSPIMPAVSSLRASKSFRTQTMLKLANLGYEPQDSRPEPMIAEDDV